MFVYDLQLWFKSFHLISMVAWMAGLFYLPRLFVYHAENGKTSRDNNQIFKVMEYKLLYYIMVPAMISTWFFGVLLIFTGGSHSIAENWFVLKIIGVLVLTGFTVWCAFVVKLFERNENEYSGRFYRLVNEVPTLLLIIIVLLVVLKPW